MVKLWDYASLTADDRSRLMRRAEQDISELLPLAQEVIADIKLNGDAAVVKYARRFDAPEFHVGLLRVTPDQFARAREQVPANVISAMELAYSNIRTCHEHQMPEPM